MVGAGLVPMGVNLRLMAVRHCEGEHKGTPCHPVRSEGSRDPASQTLRCAQGDTGWQLQLTLMGLVPALLANPRCVVEP
jgi:hypothetical protein